MGKCIYYFASSTDGFLADENGGVEWLDAFNHAGFDYGYQAFYSKIGFIISGSATFEQASNFPGGWAFPNVETYVFSSRNIDTAGRPDIHLWKRTIQDLSEKLKGEEKDTWLIGGANLAGQFAKAGLLDEVLITVIPVVLGNGKPFFDGIGEHLPLKLKRHEIFPNGVVQLTYALK